MCHTNHTPRATAQRPRETELRTPPRSRRRSNRRLSLMIRHGLPESRTLKRVRISTVAALTGQPAPFGKRFNAAVPAAGSEPGRGGSWRGRGRPGPPRRLGSGPGDSDERHVAGRRGCDSDVRPAGGVAPGRRGRGRGAELEGDGGAVAAAQGVVGEPLGQALPPPAQP